MILVTIFEYELLFGNEKKIYLSIGSCELILLKRYSTNEESEEMQYINIIIEWIESNKEWLFSGVGVSIALACGGYIGRLLRREKNKVLQVKAEEQIVQVKTEEKTMVNKESWFASRFWKMQELLNDAKDFQEKEYTVEYISSLIGLGNAGELKKYLESDIEPNDEFKEKFVNVFGVNRDWMLYGQGECPFRSNIEIFDNNPMDILREEKLKEVKSFIIVIGIYERQRHALIVRKKNAYCYELYPKMYILNSEVGGTGRHRLCEFYRFIREAYKIQKLHYCVYNATEQQFKDLYSGRIAPKKAEQFSVEKWFIEKFLNLSTVSVEQNAEFWDEDLVKVQKIVKANLPLRDEIDQQRDLSLIKRNLEIGTQAPEAKEEMMENKGKVFVSYAWSPKENKEWVELLVKRLEKDGIQVVIDSKDLKLGHDKYAFMERIVNDKTIKKVLIVCNKMYKEKADERSGGVGDESAIITPQVCGNVNQEKFIPVVNEHDEEGKPYLPNYLASRMYVDLTEFERGYRQLLDNIMEGENGERVEETIEVENLTAAKFDIEDFDDSTTFFDFRFANAFPGVRGVKEFTNPKECVDRLEILLRTPLKKEGLTSPIWWFRGASNSHIHKFFRISESKFLMNYEEIEVKKIVAYGASEYYKKFVYVEAKPEKSVGIYENVTEEYIEEWRQSYDEYHEEYALYNGRAVTRAEYDDNAAVLDGKVVDLQNSAELRIRYLTPYNFIICAQFNPINNLENDSMIKQLLNGILEGTVTVEAVINFVNKLARHRKDV